MPAKANTCTKAPKEKWLEEAKRALPTVTAHKALIEYAIKNASMVKSGSIQIFPTEGNPNANILVYRMEFVMPKKAVK